LDIYKDFCQGPQVDFKNVQRRVYDALNVLSALDIISKDKYHIIYNPHNKYINPNSNEEEHLLSEAQVIAEIAATEAKK
jgi:hypothetical protein